MSLISATHHKSQCTNNHRKKEMGLTIKKILKYNSSMCNENCDGAAGSSKYCNRHKYLLHFLKRDANAYTTSDISILFHQFDENNQSDEV